MTTADSKIYRIIDLQIHNFTYSINFIFSYNSLQMTNIIFLILITEHKSLTAEVKIKEAIKEIKNPVFMTW